MQIRTKRRLLTGLWIAINWVAVLASFLVMFVSYGALGIANHSAAGNTVIVILSVLGSVFVQGCVFAGFQTSVFLVAKAETSVMKWFPATVGGMLLGALLPLLLALLSSLFSESPFGTEGRSLGPYIITSYLLCWVTGGFVAGSVTGAARSQRLRWGLRNAGAAILYLAAILTLPALFAAMLDGAPHAASLLPLAIVFLSLPLASLGSLLNSPILHAFTRAHSGRPSS